MLPTPGELREHSRHYREAARRCDDPAAKRRLAAYALALAQLAEAIEREGETPRKESVDHYEHLLAEAQQIVNQLPSTPPAVSERRQIEAWRKRAEELRTIADQFGVPSAQDSLRRTAASFDMLADNAEARLTSRPSVTVNSKAS
jgi:hypothetical protein